MTTQASTKVRLVRCPKCRQVLAELPEVPLYKCGGCGTVLQAKYRKPETNNIGLSSHETDVVAERRQNDVLKAISSNNDFASRPEVESLSDKDNMRREDENVDSVELRENTSFSNGLSSSPEVTCEDSSAETNDFSKHVSSGQNSKRHHGRFSVDNFSDELPSSGEFTLEDERVEQDRKDQMEGDNFSDELPSSGEFTLEDQHVERNRKDQMESDNFLDELPSSGEFTLEDEHVEQNRKDQMEGDNFSDELPSSGEFTLEAEHAEQNRKDQMEGEESKNQESVLSIEGISSNYIPPENGENSPRCVTGQNRDFRGEIKPSGLDSSPESVSNENHGLPIFRSSSTEKKCTRASIDESIVYPQSPSKESLVSFYLTSPDNDRFPRDSRNFERISSLDTLGSSALPLTNYPKNESYYGSESSFDGTDDQIRTTNGFRGKVVNSEPESTYWTASSSHRTTKSTHSGQGKSTEMYRHTSGSKMRLDEQEGFSGLPFPSRNLAGHRNVGHPTNYRLPPRPVFKPSYVEPDKIELLRTVCELKDQLDRMHFPEVMPNRRFSAEDKRFAPCFYDRLAPEREIYGDVGPHGYNLVHNQAKSCGEQCNVSRMAFSGEAPNYRNRASCSCSHCCPHYSAQLPPHVKNGRCGVHTDHDRCNISNSSSPLHYTSSEYPLWGPDAQSDDLIKRAHAKEKYFAAKRHHLRPVAGGAPLIACYHCSELLRLPADFLLFGKKKYHRLMCDACKKVLRFSLREGSHIVPYVPGASAPPPPPSEAEEFNDTKPPSHSRTFRNVESVSCSDDNGPSFCRSVSTEEEYYNGKMSSGSSYEDRKMKSIMTETRNTNDASVRPSSKTSKWRKPSSEIEEASNSPLHRLMGYSSPSQVLDK